MENFKTPDFNEYLKSNDFYSYMEQLWVGVENEDAESIRILQFLAYTNSTPYYPSFNFVDDMLDLNRILVKIGDAFGVRFRDVWDKGYAAMDSAKKADQNQVNIAVVKTYQKVYTGFYHCSYDKGYYYKYFGKSLDTLKLCYYHEVGKPVKEITTELVYDESYNNAKNKWHYYMMHKHWADAYRKALPYAMKGDPETMYIVGYTLRRGESYFLKPNEEKAVEWLNKAIEAGYKDAITDLATYYRTKKDQKQFEHYCLMGADMGISSCISMLLSDIKDTPDDKARFETLLRYAEHSTEAKVQLMQCYTEGIGTKKDERKAFEVLCQLAEHSFDYKFQQADHYEKGIGTEKDEKKAFEVIKDLYNHTRVGITNSYHEDAAHILVRYYGEGIGTEKNLDKANAVMRELNEDLEKLDESLSR